MKILIRTFSLLFMPLSLLAASGDELSIPYASVEEARAALQSNPQAALTEHEGWQIYNLRKNGRYELWSFTPESHPANPSVVKRTLVKKNQRLYIDMDIICLSSQLLCDSLTADFNQINERIIKRESGN